MFNLLPKLFLSPYLFLGKTEKTKAAEMEIADGYWILIAAKISLKKNRFKKEFSRINHLSTFSAFVFELFYLRSSDEQRSFTEL